MFTITSGNNVLHSPLFVEDGIVVINPIITEELNKASTLKFTIPPTNPEYDSIVKMTSIVEAYGDNNEMFRGRALNENKDFYNRKAVYCEGELAFLLDSIMRPFNHIGGVEELFRNIIDNHNSQVEDSKKFTVGVVNVTVENDFIVRVNDSYLSTWECINNHLINMLGGYIRIRKSNNARVIDYIEDYNSVNSQVIQFGENLLDISQYINVADVFTALIPTGGQVIDGDKDVILDITSVNNGKDYIFNQAGIDKYGWIWKHEKWEDESNAYVLLAKAKQHLSKGIDISSTITIKAIDLSLIDVDVERIKLGDKIRVLSIPHNIDKYMLVSKIVRNLEDPSKSELTLGSTLQTATDVIQKQNTIIKK